MTAQRPHRFIVLQPGFGMQLARRIQGATESTTSEVIYTAQAQQLIPLFHSEKTINPRTTVLVAPSNLISLAGIQSANPRVIEWAPPDATLQASAPQSGWKCYGNPFDAPEMTSLLHILAQDNPSASWFKLCRWGSLNVRSEQTNRPLGESIKSSLKKLGVLNHALIQKWFEVAGELANESGDNNSLPVFNYDGVRLLVQWDLPVTLFHHIIQMHEKYPLDQTLFMVMKYRNYVTLSGCFYLAAPASKGYQVFIVGTCDDEQETVKLGEAV